MRKTIYISLIISTLLFSLTACQSAVNTPTITPTATSVPATATATQTPPRNLVVCLGYEPKTLYAYASSSEAMWSVLEAVYDGPIDMQNYSSVPVILSELPSADNGTIQYQAVDVVPGDEVLDINDNVVTLAEGVKVYPSGCTTESCAVESDGLAGLKMDQMTVTFKLKEGIKWSDGEPLTAADSVYSYSLDADPATPTTKYGVSRTQSYMAVDDLSVQWVGKPGFIDQDYTERFWLPMPQHAWSGMTAADLVTADASNKSPLGWGAYTIQEWAAGDHITLQKNPNYFRAGEGLPYFDTLTYRFLSDNSAANVSALQEGKCDLLDTTTFLEDQIKPMLLLEQSGFLKTYFASSARWEHLDFGINLASYDDSYNPLAGDRIDILSDARTRQAFAYCLDRDDIQADLFISRSTIPATYLPSTHPEYNQDAATYAYDPAQGQQLLDEIGWKDTDGNASTPRVAQQVTNVPDGTTLTVNYWTTNASLRQQSSERLVKSLQGCGIQVNYQTYSPGDLFAAGPTGPVFGRAFDLVQFSWEDDLLSACRLYLGSSIPNAENKWIGTNVSGYSSAAFDDACRSSLQSQPGSQQQIDAAKQAQSIYAADLPSVPLYAIVSAAGSRPDLCGFTLDPSGRSSLAGIESLNYGEGCGQ